MIVKRKNKPINRVFGGGVLNFFTSAHTYDLPEFHARQNIFGQRHHYTGPKTNLEHKLLDVDLRIPKPEFKPINKVDEYSFHHDLDYGQIKKAYDKSKKTAHEKKTSYEAGT